MNSLDFDSLSVNDFLYEGNDPINPLQTDPKEEKPIVTEQSGEEHKEPQSKEPKDVETPGAKAEERKEDEGTEVSVVGSLQEKFGFDFGDKQFEESVDGIFEMSRVAAEKIAETQLNQFFENFPELADFADYLMNGGDSSKYFETIGKTKDFSQMSISEEDTTTQRIVVDELLKMQGFDDGTRTQMIANLSKSGMLFEQAKASLPVLSKVKEGEKAKLIEQQKLDAERASKRQADEIKQIKETVTAGTLKGIQIPEAEKGKFIQWMFQPDKTGKTPRNAARESMTMEDKLALEFLVYKGFKLGDIIQKRVENAKVADIKSLIKDKSGSRMKDDTSQRKSFDIPTISEFF